jgi:hypothetical protein
VIQFQTSPSASLFSAMRSTIIDSPHREYAVEYARPTPGPPPCVWLHPQSSQDES